MGRYNKYGMSTIVSSILIFMITVIAFFGLWMIVSGIFEKEVVGKASCVLVLLDVEVDKNNDFTCVGSSTSSVVVRRGSSSYNMVGLKIKYGDGTGNTFLSGVEDAVESNLDRVYEISAAISDVAIVSVIEERGKIIICDATESVVVRRAC